MQLVVGRRFGRQSLRRESTAVLSIEARTVHDLAQGVGSCLTSQTIRAFVGATKFVDGAWISLLKETPLGEEIIGFVLGSVGQPKRL